jgi:predicted translin family RNA/ssDNA-binding protein
MLGTILAPAKPAVTPRKTHTPIKPAATNFLIPYKNVEKKNTLNITSSIETIISICIYRLHKARIEFLIFAKSYTIEKNEKNENGKNEKIANFNFSNNNDICIINAIYSGLQDFPESHVLLGVYVYICIYMPSYIDINVYMYINVYTYLCICMINCLHR